MDKLNSSGIELLAFANAFRREMAMSGHKKCVGDISPPNAKFIFYLYQSQGKDVFQKELEEAFSVRPSTVSRSLKLLENKGYIIRVPMEYDTRLKKIILTEKSWQLYSEAQNSMLEIFNKMTHNIPEEELKCFISTVQKMKNNLDS